MANKTVKRVLESLGQVNLLKYRKAALKKRTEKSVTKQRQAPVTKKVKKPTMKAFSSFDKYFKYMRAAQKHRRKKSKFNF